jgi:hypothetical protein
MHNYNQPFEQCRSDNKTDGLGNLSWTNNASNLTYTTLPTTSISSYIYNL